MFQKEVLEMKKITPIEQTTPTECGLCCLYMMLDYFDIPETYFKLKQQVNLGRNGLSIKNISDIASIYGVTCKTYRLPSAQKHCLSWYLFQIHTL